MKATIKITLALMILPLTAWCQTSPCEISFNVNGSSTAEVRPGYPLIWEVSLSSRQETSLEERILTVPDSIRNTAEFKKRLDSLGYNLSTGSDDNPWYQQILYEYRSRSIRKPEKAIKNLLEPFPSKSDVLGFNHSLRLNLGIDPGDTRKWKKGEFEVRAGFVAGTSRDTAWSPWVKIRISGRELRKISDYTSEQLYFVAGYWLRRGECDKAESFAEALLQASPSNYGYSALMGDIKYCRKDYSGALDFYEKALDIFESKADDDMKPALPLIQRIQELQERLILRKL